MRWLTGEDRTSLSAAEQCEPRTPLPLRMVASEEYLPSPQTGKQRETEARLYAIADEVAPRLGLTRRGFFQTSAGMAAGFVALNGAFGRLFDVGAAEASTPELAQDRARALSGQFIMDMHTHFLRDDTRLNNFVRMRQSVATQGWNPHLSAAGEQTIEDLKFENFFKEIYLDSDTKIALISSAPSDIPEDWFLTNRQMAEAKARVNRQARSLRMMSHAIMRPGAPGWLEELDAALLLRPDSVKGYTVGDNTHKETARYPWRMDSEETYRGYERIAAAGIRNICVHKGLWGRQLDQRIPHQGGEGLAAAQLHHLPCGLQARRCRMGARPVRPHGPDRLGHGPCRDPGAARHYERLCRCGPDLRPDPGGAAASLRRYHGAADQGARRRPCLLGHRCRLDRIAPVADRRTAPPRNSRGHADGARFRPARRR